MSLSEILHRMLLALPGEIDTSDTATLRPSPVRPTPAQKADAQAATTHYAYTARPGHDPAYIRLACLTVTHGPQRAAEMMTRFGLW